MQISDIIPSSQTHQGLQEFLEVPWQGGAVGVPQTSMPTNLGSSPPSSSLSGWSKASCEIECNKGISGSIPPLTWRVKNLLLAGPSKTAGVPEAKDLGVKD